MVLEFRPFLWTNEGDGIMEVSIQYDTAQTRPAVRRIRAINRTPRTYRFQIWQPPAAPPQPPTETATLPPTDESGVQATLGNNRYFMVQTMDPEGLPDGGYAPDGWVFVYGPA